MGQEISEKSNLVQVQVTQKCLTQTDLNRSNTNQIGPQVYKICVKDKLYTTTKKLCNISTEDIEGRATRVWEAESEDKTCVVLKDVWLDESRRPEHKLIKEVLEKEEDQKLRDYLMKSFFTAVNFKRVKIGDQEDTTKGMIMQGLQLRDDCKFLCICSDSFISMPLHQEKSLSYIALL